MNLDSTFKPESIAVIGASSNTDKLGHQIFKKILKARKVKAYPVNPQARTILKQKVYPDILSIPNQIDQAIIVIPASFVSDVLKQVIKKKVKSVIVVTAGFSETGPEGKKLELKLKSLIKKNNIALIGPNCLGYANPSLGLDITFAKTPPPKGNIALISQSGAVGSFLFDWAKQENLGFSKFASLGNRAGVNENDCLSYLHLDKSTKVIGLYLESFANGTEFLRRASQVSRTKPIVVLFGGQTELGKKATLSHTAALSPETKIISTALSQSGCIQAKSLEEFTSLLEIFSLEPPMKDNDLVILTNAGGPAILATDQTGQSDLDLVELKDILGDATANLFKSTLTDLAQVKATDAFLVIVSPQTNTDFLSISKNIVKLFKKIKKPIIVSLLGGEVVKPAVSFLQKQGIATIKFPKKAVDYFNTLFHYYHHRHKIISYPVRQSARTKPTKRKLQKLVTNFKPGLLPWRQNVTLSNVYQLPLVKTAYLNSTNLDSVVKNYGYPLVLKSDPSESIHRTEKKAIYLNLKSKTAVKKAYRDLSTRFNLVLVQPQLQTGFEFFIGLKRNKQFPPLLTLGTGGIYTEIYQDTAHAFLPLNKKLLLQLIKQTKAGQIIMGVRQQNPLDIDKLITVILNASKVFIDLPLVQNIDINPVVITSNSASIIDLKINLSKPNH
jgi:acyl-CoA synthetase (NDP forming)